MIFFVSMCSIYDADDDDEKKRRTKEEVGRKLCIRTNAFIEYCSCERVK